jgi:vancomycin resistance protein YoaR
MQLLKIIGLIWLLAIAPGCTWLQPAPKPVTDRIAAGVSFAGTDVGGKTAADVVPVLEQFARTTNTPPRNSMFGNDAKAIIPAQPGRNLNIAGTLAKLFDAPPGSNIDAVYDQVDPAISTERLTQAQRIGHYQTVIKDRTPGRVQNIRLTAQLLNNTVIEAGQEFSFNRTTGEPTPERGFQPATVFTGDGEHGQGIGGGMCQVSSTLYNAVRSAGMPVTERHPHSQPVTYVPPGLDATTYTDKDLRFRNSQRQSIILQALVASAPDTVTVNIWRLTK